MLYAPIQVSVESLGLAFGWARAEAHTTLAGHTPWRDDEATREADRRALAEFAGLGVGDARGLDADFQDTIGALTRPHSEFYGWIGTREASISVLAASAGVEAVLAIRDGDTVTLRATRREALAEALIAQLPPLAAARGRSVNIPEQDLPSGDDVRRAVRRDEGFGGLARSQPRDNSEIAQLNQVLALPRIGGGKFYTALRDRGGRRHRYPHPLAYLDNPRRPLDHPNPTQPQRRQLDHRRPRLPRLAHHPPQQPTTDARLNRVSA